MARNNRRTSDSEPNYWIGYTDLLSNTLLVLLLIISLTALERARNEKPPLVPLTEKESFRFGTGSYMLSADFVKALNGRLPEIKNTIRKYDIDVIEVVGHTDGQPSPGMSNLDLLMPEAGSNRTMGKYQAGSNTDLGLLRALAVANYLRTKLDPNGKHGLIIRPYSAGSLIANDGRFSPADTRSRADRRRIEVRFTRQRQS